MSFSIPFIVVAAFAVLLWKDLRLGLVVLAGLLPTYLVRLSFGPLPTTLLELLIVTALAVWLLKHQGVRKAMAFRDNWTRAGLLLLAAASFGVVVATDSVGALGIWKAYIVEPFLVYLMMRSMFTEKDWPHALIAVAVSSIVISTFALFQFITGLAIPVPWDIERRVTGVFDYPNALGLFAAPIVTASAVLAATNLRGWYQPQRLVWILSALLGAAAIIFAKTEAAFVAIPAALLMISMLTVRSTKKRLALAGIGVLLFTLALAHPVSRSKILLQDYSGQVRLAQWSETVQLLSDKPAFGAGLNEYRSALEPYHDPTRYEIFQYPHNILLNIWTELGLLGLVAFFWLAWLVLKKGKEANLHPAELAALAALLTMTIHGLVDVPYFKNDLSVLTWIFIAILAASTEKAIKKT